LFPVITSAHNDKLKLIRKLHQRKHREELGLFVAEGRDLLDSGVDPVFALVAGEDVEPALLDQVSSLGSGTEAIGVYRQRWSEPGGAVSVYLYGVRDPGNVGAVIRSAHAFADGPVVLGPGCADPYSPKAVRASMGSVFARPPARAELADVPGSKLVLDASAQAPLDSLELEPPLVICLGAEREGVPRELLDAADRTARIPMQPGGPESLNVAMAATVALYQAANRMARHG
jgi:RNA methyltransferase, TrmH family